MIEIVLCYVFLVDVFGICNCNFFFNSFIFIEYIKDGFIVIVVNGLKFFVFIVFYIWNFFKFWVDCYYFYFK